MYLWFSLYSSNVAREHEVRVTFGRCWLSMLEEKGRKFYCSPATLHTSPLEGTSPFPWSPELLVRHSATGQNNSGYCVCTSGRKAHQAIPQSQMGQAAILETEKGNSEKTGARAARFKQLQELRPSPWEPATAPWARQQSVQRKNPKLPDSRQRAGYMWSSARLQTELAFSLTPVFPERFFSSISSHLLQKLCRAVNKLSRTCT